MSENFITLLIGDDPAKVSALRQRFGGHIHIFSDRCRLTLRLSPFIHFHKVSGMNSDILSMYIKDFADENPYYLPLITASDKYSELLENMTDYIESCCVILNKELQI